MAFLLLSLTKARYQKCMMVQWYAELLGIELLYLPAYSPQFNLIERFRRFVKKEVLYSPNITRTSASSNQQSIAVLNSLTTNSEKNSPHCSRGIFSHSEKLNCRRYKRLLVSLLQVFLIEQPGIRHETHPLLQLNVTANGSEHVILCGRRGAYLERLDSSAKKNPS